MKEKFTFIHAADLHLDTPFAGMGSLPPQIREKVLDSTFAAYRNLIQLCIDSKVDFLLVAGDVYDATDRSLRAQIYFKEGLEQLEHYGIEAYVIHGNHDPSDGKEARLKWPSNVHFFPPGKIESKGFIRGEKEVARIYGVSYPRAQVTESYVTFFQRENWDSFAIGLLHTNVDGNASHDNYAPAAKAELIASGFDYWALGHIHLKNILHHEPTIVYPGNIQGRNIKETGDRGCFLVNVDGGQVIQMSFCPTDSLRWCQEKVDLSGCATPQDLLDLLESKKEAVRGEAQGRGVFVRFHFVGRTFLHRFIYEDENMSNVLELLRRDEEERDDFVWIDSFDIHTKSLLNREMLLQEETLPGDFLRISQASKKVEDIARLRKETLGSLLDHYQIRNYFHDFSDEELMEWLEEAESLGLDLLVAGGEEENED